ncbi:UNKNOWN [Stylonychia lemnae]|uniref:Transmembrane protein n=1 Tax=Stylonychia lemnae TaxID=5949 RepID=A0A078A274_STYLE|nr:UNKNOWN [Stylonychia lemnae]|eukprot:CDW74859.1 UNKNOWN [Stylonychia lemnae]
MKKQSEAERELERLYGPQDYEKLTSYERLKLSLVQNQYKKETLLYRIFFDKMHRPERFNTIMNQMDEFNNINEFRTFVMQKHQSFPLKYIQKFQVLPRLWQNSSNNEDPKRQLIKEVQSGDVFVENVEEGEKRGGNILMEKKYMNLYNSVYKLELFLYLLVGNLFAYMAIGLYTKTFNRNFMMGLLIPGMMANAGCMYIRLVKQKEYEMVMGPHYAQELMRYRKFFIDEGYD